LKASSSCLTPSPRLDRSHWPVATRKTPDGCSLGLAPPIHRGALARCSNPSSSGPRASPSPTPSPPPSAAAVAPPTAAAAAAARSPSQSHSHRSPCAASFPPPSAALFPARALSLSCSPAAAVGGSGWVGGRRRRPRTSRWSRSPWRSAATGSRRSRRPGTRPAWARR
jgi:hypothetical protein